MFISVVTADPQASITSGTILHSTNLPLGKWFWAIYLAPSDKGGISASRLSKHIDMSWVTAQRILRKIRTVMAQRDSIYRLKNLIEFDDALVGGKKTGKKSVVVAVDKKAKHAGFMAAATVEETSKESVQNFLQRHLIPSQEETGKWLPLVHIVIGNLKTFLNGIFHGVSGKYLAEDIGEFCYRFNQRFWGTRAAASIIECMPGTCPALNGELFIAIKFKILIACETAFYRNSIKASGYFLSCHLLGV